MIQKITGATVVMTSRTTHYQDSAVVDRNDHDASSFKEILQEEVQQWSKKSHFQMVLSNKMTRQTKFKTTACNVKSKVEQIERCLKKAHKFFLLVVD